MAFCVKSNVMVCRCGFPGFLPLLALGAWSFTCDNKLDLINAGDANVSVMTHDKHFKQVLGEFGALQFQFHCGRSDNAVATFMKDLDPSMYMSADKHAHRAEPEYLSFAAVGNLSLQLQSSTVKCDLLRFGYWHNSVTCMDGWLIGSDSCRKSKTDPHGKSHNPSDSLICPCHQGVFIQFQQSEKARNQIITSISDCTAIRTKTAKWVDVGSSPSSQTYTFTYGVDRSYEVQQIEEWGQSTTISMTNGFSYDGYSLSVTVSHTTSHEFTESHTSIFGMSQKETYTTTVGRGVLWQFQVVVTDDCGTSTIHMKDFTVTKDLASPPCCLPGYFKDEDKPTGECLSVAGENYNVCKKEVVIDALV
jgi:hypothetical protein